MIGKARLVAGVSGIVRGFNIFRVSSRDLLRLLFVWQLVLHTSVT